VFEVLLHFINKFCEYFGGRVLFYSPPFPLAIFSDCPFNKKI
jgi:hypothetical protein